MPLFVQLQQWNEEVTVKGRGAIWGTVLTVAAAAPVSVLAQDEALALARDSGCMACHALDKKVVGPAWRDIAARYKGQDVRDKLVASVKNGSKGKWTETTGGIPMPPYSPRVADEDIRKLVDYIVSLSAES